MAKTEYSMREKRGRLYLFHVRVAQVGVQTNLNYLEALEVF